MDNLDLPNAKILFLVSELWKEKEINNDTKINLKSSPTFLPL